MTAVKASLAFEYARALYDRRGDHVVDWSRRALFRIPPGADRPGGGGFTYGVGLLLGVAVTR